VLTFDYRGIGQSRSTSIKELPARMRDWAQLDAPAAPRCRRCSTSIRRRKAKSGACIREAAQWLEAQ